MLRIKKIRKRSWITWDRPDTRVLSRLIYHEDVASKRTAVIDSVLKMADDHGLMLSPKLSRRLRRAVTVRERMRQIRNQEDTELPRIYPRKLVKRFRGHQRVALEYIDAAYEEGYDGFLLADQPGVGKTPVAIAWACRRANKRVLVICPNSAKYQWRKEIKRWTVLGFGPPQTVSIVEGIIEEQNQIARDRNGWVIAHWESLVHAWDGILENPWDAVIVDEGHKAVNREAQKTQTLFCLSYIPNRLVLTAHPYVNNPGELWSILHFLYPQVYSAYWRFMAQHVDMIPKPFGGVDILGTRFPKLLRWEIAPFTLRRTKKRVFKDVQQIQREVRHVEMTKHHIATYKRLQKDFFAEVEGREKRLPILNVLSRTTRIRQFLVDPSLLDSTLPSLKYPVVLELVEELDGPPVIFTSFREAATRLADYLGKRGYTIGLVHGKIKGKKRDRVQRRFLAGKYDAVIMVTQAGGESLNYGRYGYVIFLDLPWNAKDLEQAEGRVDRPDAETGDLVPTTAFRIVVKNSYEERLEDRIEEKHDRFEEVFRISRRDLCSLFNPN